MGTLLEALWGYWVNKILDEEESEASNCELVWLSHQYNDFACILKDSDWDADSREGEILRIEAKSMNLDADESKGHFDELRNRLGTDDLLLVLFWHWRLVDEYRVAPYISDHFIDLALPVAELRDALHLARGGSFVDRHSCPDRCDPSGCLHHGEPLNASGSREKLSGPENCKPSGSSFGANYGGLVRMLKTSGHEAKKIFHRYRAQSDVADSYISLVHRNIPKEEYNQYSSAEWSRLAKYLGPDLGLGGGGKLKKEEAVERIRARYPAYQSIMRRLFDPDSEADMGPLGSLWLAQR